MINRGYVTQFQFHKVQLKVGRYRDIYTSTMFQFHKVQLKELAEAVAEYSSLVSIP